MTSAATTPEQYLDELPSDRKEAIARLRKTISENLPKGFEESIGYGMLTYVVPHSKYPAGYHCNPAQALPFVSLASQKNFIALYHMGLYMMPDLLKWFQDEYPKRSSKKMDMGKSCIHFKKPGDIPYDLLGELMKKVTPGEWIKCYEANIKK